MKFNSLIPELSVTDIEKSKKFYLNLGFKIMYERKEDKFCFLYLEDNQIMIEEINNNWNVGEMKYPFGNGINISMTVSDIDSFYENIISKKFVLFRKIKTSKYRVDDIIYEDKEFLNSPKGSLSDIFKSI
mgnify:FL=1